MVFNSELSNCQTFQMCKKALKSAKEKLNPNNRKCPIYVKVSSRIYFGICFNMSGGGLKHQKKKKITMIHLAHFSLK